MPAEDEVRAPVAVAADAAATFGGVVSRLSAAVSWGWPVLHLPHRPQITVPRNRRLSGVDLSAVSVRRLDLPATDIDGQVTVPDRTVVDCLRYLPETEGLCVADSALRSGMGQARLSWLAAIARGPGATRVRLIARHADARAANPFESALRAICLSVSGLDVEPQVTIRDPLYLGRPDLVREALVAAVAARTYRDPWDAAGAV